MDAQVHLNLRLVHMSEGTFFQVAAHLLRSDILYLVSFIYPGITIANLFSYRLDSAIPASVGFHVHCSQVH